MPWLPIVLDRGAREPLHVQLHEAQPVGSAARVEAGNGRRAAGPDLFGMQRAAQYSQLCRELADPEGSRLYFHP